MKKVSKNEKFMDAVRKLIRKNWKLLKTDPVWGDK
jgi:hypothetical protein